jgi:dienelactone hydrolase
METAGLRRQGRRLFVWLVAAAVVAAVVGSVYLGTPLHGTAASIAAVEENPNVTVGQRGGAYVLEPVTGEPSAGLVFYPGARVHPDAYLASLAPIAAEADMRVIIPRMPLNLAVLDQGAAAEYVSETGIDQWYVGGHSLGGAMACRYAHANPGAVDGLILYASYCDRDVSASGLAVLSLTGSADTVLNWNAYERNLDKLPRDAAVRELPLNHSQFGSYRGQRGDDPSGLSYAVAHDRLADATLSWLRSQE